MSLPITPVSRCLEKRLVILGFEVPDLLAILFVLSVLNFLFGWTGMRFLLVWLPTLAVAAILRIGKMGKPDNYLLHLVRYWAHPKYLSAFHESRKRIPPHMLVHGALCLKPGRIDRAALITAAASCDPSSQDHHSTPQPKGTI